MKSYDILVIGGGPAGLSAALTAASAGLKKVLIVDDGMKLGGQLVKQTHKFFGSANQFAGVRGIDIAQNLTHEINRFFYIEVLTDSIVTGYYEDGIVTIVKGSNGGEFIKVKPRVVIVATGALENMLPLVNNDLPGVYGAGAVQTLMNVYGIVPGKEVLMIGAGNIGLIVAYQLMQANIHVQSIVEAMPYIGGYWVHASKIRRLGVPIYTSYTIKEIIGKSEVEKVKICKIDNNFNLIAGTEKELIVDTVCLAVGLSPLAELLWQAGCQMQYVPELGGYVALRDENMKTSLDHIYIAGDVSGIEEASSAMIEGKIAGLNAAASLGYKSESFQRFNLELKEQLDQLRANSMSISIKKGIKKATIKKGEEYVYKN